MTADLAVEALTRRALVIAVRRRDEPRKWKPALPGISDRSLLVLGLRFGLDHRGPMTRDEIADRLGVTRERVRQIERGAIASLGSPAFRWRFENARDLLAAGF
jgi:DNA-directed RNA polymerase sigma subunit (sigma70/sigma32)